MLDPARFPDAVFLVSVPTIMVYKYRNLIRLTDT